MDIHKKIAAAAAIAVAVSGVPVTVHAAEKPLNAEYADSFAIASDVSFSTCSNV